MLLTPSAVLLDCLIASWWSTGVTVESLNHPRDAILAYSINILDIWPTDNIWWPLEYSWVLLTPFAVLIDRWIAPLWCTGVTGWSKNHTRGAILTSFSTYFDQIELFYGQQTIFDDPYINPGCIVNKLNLTCKLRNRFIPMVRNYWHKKKSRNNFYGYKMKACMEKHRKTKYLFIICLRSGVGRLGGHAGG